MLSAGGVGTSRQSQLRGFEQRLHVGLKPAGWAGARFGRHGGASRVGWERGVDVAVKPAVWVVRTRRRRSKPHSCWASDVVGSWRPRQRL